MESTGLFLSLIGMLLGSLLISGFGVWLLYFVVGLIAVNVKITSEE